MSPAAAPLYEFTSHIAGKNAKVEIYPDRIEWFRNRSVVAGVTAATMTAGISMLKTGIPGGRKGTEMIPIKTISSVNTKRDGMLNTIVSVITTGNSIDFRVKHAEAAQVRDILNRLILGDQSPTVVVQAPAAAPAAQVGPDITAQLQQLGGLRDAGILTEEEFSAKKAELLARL